MAYPAAARLRRLLDAMEREQSRLKVQKENGAYVWTSRDNKRLTLFNEGPFTYLSAAPGQYIRFTRVNDRITYVEHIDSPIGSVTWFGELRVVLGKRLEDHLRPGRAGQFGGAGGRVVVADDDFAFPTCGRERTARLRQRLQGRAEELLFVEGRDDDRDGVSHAEPAFARRWADWSRTCWK